MKMAQLFLIVVFCSCITTSLIAKTKSARARHSMEFFNTHNVLRIESYLSFQTNNGVMTTGYPNLLIRYGLIKVLELRLGLELSSVNDHNSYTVHTGINPIQPGFKIRLVKPKGLVPATAFTGSISIPKAASPAFRQTYWAPTFQFSAEQDITPKLSLEYALGMQWDGSDFSRSYLTSINMEFDFTPTSSVYADAYWLLPEHDQSDIRIDVGVNRTITQNLQFDLSTGAGLTPAAPEFFFNIGFIFSYNSWKKLLMHKNSFTQRPVAHPSSTPPR